MCLINQLIIRSRRYTDRFCSRNKLFSSLSHTPGFNRRIEGKHSHLLSAILHLFQFLSGLFIFRLECNRKFIQEFGWRGEMFVFLHQLCHLLFDLCKILQHLLSFFR